MLRPLPSLARPSAQSLAFVWLLFGAFATACNSGDASRKIDDARVAHAQGRLDEAEQLYGEALESEPDNPAALVGLANIHLDREDLEAAASRFARLEELELDRRSEQLVARARLRYDRLVYARARGQGPANPADPEAYEQALIGLFNAEGEQQYAQEIIQLFTRQARLSLGVTDPSEPILPNSAYVQDAPLETLRTAREAYQRLAQRDPRLTRVLSPPDALRQEAQAMMIALQLEVFDREVDEGFNARLRGPLVAAERFNTARNMFRVVFVSPEPYQGERPAEGEPLETFKRELALTLVIEEMTDLAYQLKGIERGTARPLQLGRTLDEVRQAYAGIEVAAFEFSADGVVSMEVLAPYHLLPRTAYRLEQYLEWRAHQPEGSGIGTGEPVFQEGTGQPPFEEGTGAAPLEEGTGASADEE